MNYKEFYIWLDGFTFERKSLTVSDIRIIRQKMKEVKDEKEIVINDFISKSRPPQVLPIFPKEDKDDLGHPPKIVM